MTETRATALVLFLLALPSALPAAAQEAPTPPAPIAAPTAERDVWPDEALTDDEAAAEARRSLPFTQAQIEALGQLFRQSRRAAALARGPAPAGRIRRLHLDGAGEVPVIALAQGYTTVLSITDATGAPWPIVDVALDAAFLPEGGEGGAGAGESAAGARHLLYLSPRAAFADGNALIKLQGLPEPLAVALAAAPGAADFRVDIRLARPGPGAARVPPPAGFHAGDAVLLGLLAGQPPADAVALEVSGAAAGRAGRARAWRRGGALLLTLRESLLSPGPSAAERAPDGRWAYRLPDTPHVLVSRDGRMVRLSFREPRPDAPARADLLHPAGTPPAPTSER